MFILGFDRISGLGFFISFIVAALAVVISMVSHELAHGYVALWNGDYTAKYNHRLTVNPLAHFDLIGFIMLMTVGFGYAKPVPINPNNFKHRKRGIFTVAIAGVTVNLVLAFLSMGLGLLTGFFQVRTGGALSMFLGFVRMFFEYMIAINLSLALFNVIPIYPLDGFRVVEAFTRFTNPVAKFFRDYGQYILIVLVGLSLLSNIVSSYVGWWPWYLDPLGSYISYGRYGITSLYGMFWGLIF